MARTVICDTCGKALGNPQCPTCRRPPQTPDSSPPPAAAATLAGSGPVLRDRRDPTHQRPLIGGARQSDPPLTTRDCADWMGVTTEFIRGAVDDGQLEAEDAVINGRRIIRVHLDQFVAYLQKIGWKRLPRRPCEADGAPG